MLRVRWSGWRTSRSPARSRPLLVCWRCRCVWRALMRRVCAVARSARGSRSIGPAGCATVGATSGPTVLVVDEAAVSLRDAGLCSVLHRVDPPGGAAAPCDGPVVRGDRPRCCGPLDGGGGAVVPGGLGHGVAGHRRGGAGQARPPPRARPPRHLGIDETTFRRYRSFMTGLVDLDGPRLWDFIEGRSKKVLVDRLEALGESVHSIEAVVIDPYAGYKAAVRDAAPQSDPRRRPLPHRGSRQRGAHRRANPTPTGNLWPPRPQRRPAVVGAPRPAAGPGNISPTAPGGASARRSKRTGGTNSNAPGRSRRCSETSTPAPTAPPPKPHSRTGTLGPAPSDVAETNRLAKTLRSWEPELLAYFDTGLTNGPTEGINRIIKAVKRQGFGYTNADNYRIRVLYRCA